MSEESYFGSLLNKAKAGLKKTVFTVSSKTKEVLVKTRNYVQTSIENSKKQKEIKYQNEVDEYNGFLESQKSSLTSDTALYFLNNLDKSPTELTEKKAGKIKQTFPIPYEQIIFWSIYIKETTRVGGLVITDKGIFIKSIVNVFEEKTLNKEKRKISQLLYYPWDYFDIDTILNEANEDVLKSFGEQNVRSFIATCEKCDQVRQDRKIGQIKYYSRSEQVSMGETAVVSGTLLKGKLKFTRDNGYANNPNAGFGLFAEQANNMADIAHFKNAKVVGGDNAKNGPDRLVNGVRYQTKYYKTGARSVGATFDNGGTGNYRYYNPDGTPMKLEVPKGQYESAVKTFKNKIAQGKVPGVTDPNEAENIIVEGHYTIEQTINMAKAGTIESLAYDIKTGSVVSSCIFGISFLIDSYICYKKTKDKKEALISGLCAGGKAGALALATHVLVSQLSRTDIFLRFMTKNIIKSGIANGAIGFIVFSIPETISFALKRISKAQYATNLAVLSASIIGGTAGAYAGGAIGTTIGAAAGAGAGSVPLAIAGGTGGVVGGIAAGAAAGISTSKIIDIFFEGDDKRLARLFNAISFLMFIEYLLNESEIDLFIEKMNKTSDRQFKKLFGDILSSKNQEQTIRNFLIPYFDEIVKNREKYNPDYELLSLETIG